MTRLQTTCETLLRVYRAAERPIQVQFWMTVIAIVLAVAVKLSAQTPIPITTPEAWYTPQNLLTAGMLVYGIGMTVQNFRDVGRRLTSLEEDFKNFREKVAPDTYVRQDVFEERMGRRQTDPIVVHRRSEP